MAGWIDFFSLFVTIGVLGGMAYGVIYIVNQISESIKSTKESLKSKGYEISDKGVSIKTSKRFDRQDYIDATQRGMLKTMTAASFNRRTDSIDGSSSTPSPSPSSPYPSPLPSAPSSSSMRPAHMERAESATSVKSGGSAEKRKKGLFGMRKNSH